MLYLGSQFLVANIAPYIESYYPECSKAESQTLLPLANIVAMIANFFGSNLFKKRVLHPKVYVAIFGSVGILGCYFSSYLESFQAFKYVFAITLGFTNGATYMTGVSIAWQYFPGREGLISGTIIGGFGIGSFVFTYMSTKLINPEGIDNQEEGKPFDMDVA